jgi:hypothetical protein
MDTVAWRMPWARAEKLSEMFFKLTTENRRNALPPVVSVDESDYACRPQSTARTHSRKKKSRNQKRPQRRPRASIVTMCDLRRADAVKDRRHENQEIPRLQSRKSPIVAPSLLLRLTFLFDNGNLILTS